MNYSAYYSSRAPNHKGTFYGGTAIFVKSSLPHHPIKVPDFQEIEATAITLNFPNSVPYTFASTYIPPSSRAFPSHEFDALLGLSNNLVLAGDLNCRHVSWDTKSNYHGQALFSKLQAANLRAVVPSTPTHISVQKDKHIFSFIDLAIFKNVPYNHSIRVINELNSDHLPVCLTLAINSVSLSYPTEVHTNWDDFKYKLSFQPPPPLKISSTDDIDRCIQEMNQLLLETAAEVSKPKTKPPNYQSLPSEIRVKLSSRNRLRKLWQRTRCPDHRQQFLSLQAECRADIYEHTQTTWKQHLEKLSPNDHSLWRTAKNLRTTRAAIPPLGGGTGGMAITDEQKANRIAECLEAQFTPNHDPTYENNYPVFDELDSSSWESAYNSTTPNNLEHTTPQEVMTYINKLHVSKSPGPDGITNRMLKNLPGWYYCWITLLINMMLDNCYFPKIWREACVVPIHKSGSDNSLPGNYRPISLLSSFSKIYEYVLRNRLDQFCLDNNIITPEQHGFRRNHSTDSQLLRVTESVLEEARNARFSAAVFFDIAKAFDKCHIPGLISKLVQLGFSNQFVKIIHSYLSDRTYRVRVGSTLSPPHPIRAGTPQGSLISPLLFLIYINDIPKDPSVKLAIFADDTAVLATDNTIQNTINRLQMYIYNSLTAWLVRWRIAINASKSQLIIFPPNTVNYDHSNVFMYIFNERIPVVDTAKYLGVLLDSKLTFKNHILDKVEKATKSKIALSALIGRKSFLSLKNKLLLYKQILVPQILYASVVWAGAAKCHIRKLQVFQNRVFRDITQLPWFVSGDLIHQDLKTPAILEQIRKNAENFYLQNCSRPCLDDIENYDPSILSNCRKRPRSILINDSSTFAPPAKRAHTLAS